jgi:hypothetical protein
MHSIIFSKRVTMQGALVPTDLIYDPHAQINMVRIGEQLVPAIDQPLRLPTNSKTHQAPTDDDPDPSIEDLY